MKYGKIKQNVRDYSSWHPYKDLLKVKELIHYVNFVADDATANVLILDIIKKASKNARENNCYKLNKPLTFLKYIENCNTFKHFLKTDSELTVDDDLVLKSNQIVIPSDLQNYVIPLAH